MKIKLIYSSVNIIVLFVFLVGITFSSCKNSNENKVSTFYHPAEFESCNVTSFVWTNDTVFHEIVLELTGIISQKDKVRIYFESNYKDKKLLPELFKQDGANLNNIEYVELEEIPQSVWLRDYGPVYLQTENGENKIVSFKYFGNTFSFNQQIANKRNIPITHSSLNSSGGAREVNGKGTVLLVESHELDVNKNKTKIQIEEAIKEELKLTKVIWLKKGIPQDDNILDGPIFQQIYPDGVNGHIDEFCRFVNENTILISSVDESEAEKMPIFNDAKKRLDENYNILVNSTDQDGNKFNVVKVPFAPVLVARLNVKGEMRYTTPVTSYMNFIITNSFIILPSYIFSASDSNLESYTAKEKEVVSIFQQVFPEKEIVKIPAAEINFHSGGFHCLSIHEPF